MVVEEIGDDGSSFSSHSLSRTNSLDDNNSNILKLSAGNNSLSSSQKQKTLENAKKAAQSRDARKSKMKRQGTSFGGAKIKVNQGRDLSNSKM